VHLKATLFRPDKPRFWVISKVAWLCGMCAGLMMAAAASLQLFWLARSLGVLFVACWVVGVVSHVSYALRALTGRYNDLEPRPWKEQDW